MIFFLFAPYVIPYFIACELVERAMAELP